MVFRLIKGMFKSKEEILGDLFIKNKLLGNYKLELQKTNLFFSKEFTFDLKKVVDLDYKNNTLLFTHENNKYKFVTKCDLEDLYKKVHPLTSQVKNVFTTRQFEYKIYNTEKSMFIDTLPDLVMKILEDESCFYLKIETEDEIIHFEEITTETQYYCDKPSNTFVWSVNKDNKWYTFSVTFPDNINYLEFITKYVGCTYKNEENDEYFNKMEGENYKEQENEDVFESAEESEIQEEAEDRVILHTKDTEYKNEHLVVGNERAFVTRGSSVGVFENSKEGLKFKENLSEVMKNPAKKIISHDKCKSLIYLDREDTKVLHKIDLDRPDIIETWNIKRSINDYFDGSKLRNSETLIGLSDYSVFRIDPRTKEKVSQCKEYKIKNEFMCGMSTDDGHVAVASKNGDLRLYDKIDKRAKSRLPGFGDEVKFVDVTTNGQHILCTSKNYILLYTVNGNYKNSVGKDKPVPKKLILRPEHLAYINEEINFTPAKFSTDSNEDSIITSTGKYVVRWNLKDVLEGRIFTYQLSRCSDLVVADNFEFGVNDNIIVTMPDDVRTIKGSLLKRPNKKNL